MNDDELISAREAAQIIGKSMATVARWRREGLLIEMGRNRRGEPLYSKEGVELTALMKVTPRDLGPREERHFSATR